MSLWGFYKLQDFKQERKKLGGIPLIQLYPTLRWREFAKFTEYEGNGLLKGVGPVSARGGGGVDRGVGFRWEEWRERPMKDKKR